MSSEDSSNKKPRNRGRGGRGRGRGGGGGRGRGGSGGGSNNDSPQPGANFAGRGPKNFDQAGGGSVGGGGRGAGNSGRGSAAARGGRGGGSGPKHMGTERSRPDRIVPHLPIDSSDDEEDDEHQETDIHALAAAATAFNEGENKQLDHIAPVNAAAASSKNKSSNAGSEDTATQQQQQQQQQRERHAYCLVCYSSKLHVRRTISPCGHDDVCWTCHLQMRYLHSDHKCPVCKTSNETLIVDTDNVNVDEVDASDGSMVHHKRFNQYQLWGNDLGGGFVYRDDVGMHFPTSIYEREVLPLLGYACGIKGCEFTNQHDSYVNEKDMREGNNGSKKGGGREVKKRLTGLKALKAHLRIDHGYCICDLCVENKRDFVSRLVRYTPQGLKHHQSKGDGEYSGFNGHPLCEFCRPLRFYDIVKLHDHLNKEHYKCHICDKQGKPNQFFKDYPRLERHFDRDHFLCHDAQCLQARFVVFENEIDLRGHESSVHGTNRRDGGTKIKLEFRVRREGEQFEQQNVPTGEDFQFGLNGEAFVPDALPGDQQQRQVNEPDISHPLHAARTAELRAQAARVRERDGTATYTGGSGGGSGQGSEAFPALGMDATDSAAAGNAMLVGWTSDGARTAAGRPGVAGLRKTPVGKVTEEEFPSLGPGPGGGSRNTRAAMGLGRKAGTKQPQKTRGGNFSAIAAAANVSTPMSSVSYASSVPMSAPDMNRDNFPSLGGGPRPFVPSMPAASSSMSSSRAAPNLRSTDNFPSLGGGPASSMGGPRSRTSAMQSSNPYAAAQAHARKLNAGKAPGSTPSAAYPALSSKSDFPAPPIPSGGARKTNVQAAFAPKKPPPMDNVLQFPPPSSMTPTESLQAGKETVQNLKQLLGNARYKKLKSLTKDFANGATPPESYVDDAASLFDQGVRDMAFWDHIPTLIRDIPNERAVERAMRHLESVRMANEMQELEFGGGGGGNAIKKKPINYVLPTKKTTNSWGNSTRMAGGGPSDSTATKLSGKQSVIAAASSSKNNNATKNGNDGGSKQKKNKTKKKNNELKALAFGI